MAFIQWRRFDFFAHSYLENAAQTDASPKLLLNEQDSNGETLDTFAKLKKVRITCSDSGRGRIVLGDQNGWIHRLDNNFEMESFQAFDYEVISVQQIAQNPYLITAGSDEQNRSTIKIWNQDKIDPHKQMPTCIRTIKNSSMNSINSRITCLRATDALTFMSIGYDDGNLVTIRGDLLKEKSCKHKRIELCKDPITGIFLKGTYQNVSSNFLNNRLLPLNLKQNKQVSAFITTSRQVYFFEMKNDQEKWNLIENDFGCTTGHYCCLINDGKHLDNCLFILGRKDAIYFYQNDGRGPCLAFDNEKLILHWFKGYLIVVSKESLPFPANLTDSVDSVVAQNADNEKHICTIYDIRNKYIAFSATFSSINQIFTEWGYIFVLLDNGRLVQIREKDMNSKLELLFKKQQYSLAIELARSQNFDSDNLTDIFKEYADHLYKQGDFENAISQYTKTIGKLEPSYVIRRYLEGQKAKNLTSYLYRLHEQGLANRDHTSLYLNCLTKSENTGQLIAFLRSFDDGRQPNDEAKKQLLDVQNAISVLRKSKLYDQALYLSELYNCYDLYFKIQIEDKRNYLDAIKFIQTKLLNEKDLFFNQYFVKYSKQLFREKPAETTQLLKRICEKLITSTNDQPNEDKQKKSFFYIDILNSNLEKLIEFLEFLQEQSSEFKERTVSNTLLELYLQNYRTTADVPTKTALEGKILRLLRDDGANYDDERAMILCQVNKFGEGMKFLYEKLELYGILIFQCIECKDDDEIIKICEKYGCRDPNLWVKAFLYFAKLDGPGSAKRENYLLRTIDEVTKRKLLPPLSISNLLSSNESISLATVKNYLVNSLAKENETITECEGLIKQYKDENDRIVKQIEIVELNGKAFQSNKCSICNNFLDLPAVHFFCSHSFHQHCFQSHCGEDEHSCPLCVQEQRKVLHLAEIGQTINNEELKDRFLKSVNKSDADSFAIVSSYFSKNLFDLN